MTTPTSNQLKAEVTFESGYTHKLHVPWILCEFLDITKAGFLSEVHFWGRSNIANEIDPDGWVTRTQEKWRKRLGISTKQIGRMTKALEEKGYIETELRRLSGKTQTRYRTTPEFYEAYGAFITESSDKMSDRPPKPPDKMSDQTKCPIDKMSDHRSDKMSDHRSDKMSDHRSDKMSGSRSDKMSDPSLLEDLGGKKEEEEDQVKNFSFEETPSASEKKGDPIAPNRNPTSPSSSKSGQPEHPKYSPVKAPISGEDQSSAAPPVGNVENLQPWEKRTQSGRIVVDDVAKRAFMGKGATPNVPPPSLTGLFQANYGGLWQGPGLSDWKPSAIATAKRIKQQTTNEPPSDYEAKKYITNMVYDAQNTSNWGKVDLFFGEVTEFELKQSAAKEHREQIPGESEGRCLESLAAEQELTGPPDWFVEKFRGNKMAAVIAPQVDESQSVEGFELDYSGEGDFTSLEAAIAQNAAIALEAAIAQNAAIGKRQKAEKVQRAAKSVSQPPMTSDSIDPDGIEGSDYF